MTNDAITLYDLKAMLDQAIAAGAEDHDPVFVEREVRHTETHFDKNGNALPAEIDEFTETVGIERLELRRNGRREIWLR